MAHGGTAAQDVPVAGMSAFQRIKAILGGSAGNLV
jgi:hypothetical protein